MGQRRDFSSLESDVCCSFQYYVLMQLTGSSSCIFLLVIFAINEWDGQAKSGHSGLEQGYLLQSGIVWA